MEQKQKQKFEEQWKKIVNLTGSNTPEKVGKVTQNEVVEMFQEIAKERMEEVRKRFKAKLAGILEAKLALDKTLENNRQEINKKEEKEYETLNNEINDAFRVLENAQKQTQSLVSASEGNFDPSGKEEWKKAEELEEGKTVKPKNEDFREHDDKENKENKPNSDVQT